MTQDEINRMTELQVRVSDLEKKLEFVMNHLQLQYLESGVPNPAMTAVADWLRKGNKIEAIKAYRLATNVGLAEAKAAVEGLEIQLGLRLPPTNTYR